MPQAQRGGDGDGETNVSVMMFMYMTYIAFGFVIFGWVSLIYVTIKMHQAARTGELLHGDCNKGYLELETGQAFALKAYLDGGFKQKFESAMGLFKIGMAFLATSLFMGLAYTMAWQRWRKNINPWALQPDNIPKLNRKWAWGALAWALLSAYTASTSIAVATEKVSDNKKLTLGFMITAIVLLFGLYLFAKNTLEKQFFEREDMFIASNLWPLTLVLAGGLWLASTMYYKNIDARMNDYVSVLQQFQQKLALVDKYYLSAHVAKNFVSTPQPVDAAQSPDDPPSVESVKLLFNDDAVRAEKEKEGVPYIADYVYYIMHFYGEELRDVEERILEEHREAGTSGSKEEISAIQSVRDVRAVMNTIRAKNDEFNKAMALNTGAVIGASALVILVPMFLLYKRVAPAVFGAY